VLDTLNGKPSAYNSAGGVNRFMKVSFGANLAQPNTYFHLGSHTNAVGYILDNESGATQSAIYQGSGTSLRLFAGTDLSLTYTPNIAAQRLIFAMTNSTTSRLGVNGATGSTGNANTGFMNGITLGASVSSTLGNFAHHQELIIFNSNELTNRAGIEANINSFLHYLLNMLGYTYTTEQEAIDARAQAATYMGLPNPQGDTLYWVNYTYTELDGFYYIEYVEGLEVVLGEPTEFTVTFPELN
jgi:hypothetical protein